MNKKIESLKAAAAIACDSCAAEKDRLTAAGYKSAERYAMLKDLKAAADAAHSLYRAAANSAINSELNAIIRAGRPAREAAARARSPWKQVKFDAANK